MSHSGTRRGAMEEAIEVDPDYQGAGEAEPTSQHKSTLLDQLMRLNESNLCNKLTNAIFILLALVIVALLGLVIAMCVNPSVVGVDVYRNGRVADAMAMTLIPPM